MISSLLIRSEIQSAHQDVVQKVAIFYHRKGKGSQFQVVESKDKTMGTITCSPSRFQRAAKTLFFELFLLQSDAANSWRLVEPS
jgi:hypothetical protein